MAYFRVPPIGGYGGGGNDVEDPAGLPTRLRGYGGGRAPRSTRVGGGGVGGAQGVPAGGRVPPTSGSQWFPWWTPQNSAGNYNKQYVKRFNKFYPFYLTQQQPIRAAAADDTALWLQNALQGHAGSMERHNLMGSGYDLFARQMLHGGRQARNQASLVDMYRNALLRTHGRAAKLARKAPNRINPGAQTDWAAVAGQLGSAAIGGYALSSGNQAPAGFDPDTGYYYR